MELKKNCRSCSKEMDPKKKTKAFCNMECYKNFMVNPKPVKVEIPIKQEVITINKNDSGWIDRFFSFLSSK